MKNPGEYRCRACDHVLGEAHFCHDGLERFAAAFAYVGLAISDAGKMGFERARKEYLCD